MVPVGRLTLVRTFAKSELIRAMSFVAIPGLVGPMLGPVAGGLIVGYFHWRLIFFVNIPIGIFGLLMVYLHLPDYREEETHPLDIVGLILFGSGIALLSYVLEIFGEHTLSVGEILGLLALSLVLLAGYLLHAKRTTYPLLQLALFRIRTFRAAVSGSFFTRLGIGGVPFLLPLLYQVGLGFSAIQSGLLIMPQAIAAMSTKFLMPKDSGPGWLPWGADFEHRDPRPSPHPLRDHRAGHARLVNRAAGVLLWDHQFAAIYQHEYPYLCGHRRRTDQQREFHRQHHAADVHKFRGCVGWACYCIFHSRSRSHQPGRNDPRHTPGAPRAWRIYHLIHDHLPQIEKWRRQQRQPTKSCSQRVIATDFA